MKETRAISRTSTSVTCRKPMFTSSTIQVRSCRAARMVPLGVDDCISDPGDAQHLLDIVNADNICAVHHRSRHGGRSTLQPFVHGKIKDLSDKRFSRRPN